MNIDDIAKLDANENPYGPSKGIYIGLGVIILNRISGVLEALSEMKFQHIYPDPESRRLRSALVSFIRFYSSCVCLRFRLRFHLIGS
jgi:histidinol-phosphate aminotransferase